MAVDRRSDTEGRDRLSEIQAGYERWTRRTFWALVVLGATFVATVGVDSYLIRENSQRAAQTRSIAAQSRTDSALTHGALCSLRADLESRIVQAENQITQTVHYLASHPKGFPGVPAAVIKQNLNAQRQTLDGQRRTVTSLSALRCGR